MDEYVSERPEKSKCSNDFYLESTIGKEIHEWEESEV